MSRTKALISQNFLDIDDRLDSRWFSETCVGNGLTRRLPQTTKESDESRSQVLTRSPTFCSASMSKLFIWPHVKSLPKVCNSSHTIRQLIFGCYSPSRTIMQEKMNKRSVENADALDSSCSPTAATPLKIFVYDSSKPRCVISEKVAEFCP